MTPSDVQIVADNLDDFIEVPDGVARLRKAVLALAVSGKLVPQDPKEGTAEDLYNKIHAERTKQDSEGRKKKVKDVAIITPAEIPFSIPKSWKWVRLGDCMSISSGDSLKVSEATEGDYLVYGGNGIAGRHSSFNALKGTIVIGRVGALCGAVHIVETDAWVTDNAFIVTYPEKFLDKDFFAVVLGHLNLRKSHRGSAQPVISGISIYPTPMPLPPLAEQKRIVKKVEEVMKQLDDLEAKKRERDEVRTRLARSAMQSLGKGKSKIAFEQLTELIKTPADIKELESALLTLAVSGKLVPQDTKEGSASQKDEVGQKKRERDFATITQDELPFDIPKAWKWVRLGSLFTDYGSGSTPSRGNDEFYRGGHTNWYKSGELNDGILSADSEEKITTAALEKSHLRLNKHGDLLIAMYGATAGRVAVFNNEGTTNQAVWGGTPLSSVLVWYLFYYVLQSRHELLKTSSGAAQPNISGEKIAAHVVPLPPLAEQKRIVKKIEEVMALVSHLREVLGETKSHGRGRPKK